MAGCLFLSHQAVFENGQCFPKMFVRINRPCSIPQLSRDLFPLQTYSCYVTFIGKCGEETSRAAPSMHLSHLKLAILFQVQGTVLLYYIESLGAV